MACFMASWQSWPLGSDQRRMNQWEKIKLASNEEFSRIGASHECQIYSYLCNKIFSRRMLDFGIKLVAEPLLSCVWGIMSPRYPGHQWSERVMDVTRWGPRLCHKEGLGAGHHGHAKHHGATTVVSWTSWRGNDSGASVMISKVINMEHSRRGISQSSQSATQTGSGLRDYKASLRQAGQLSSVVRSHAILGWQSGPGPASLASLQYLKSRGLKSNVSGHFSTESFITNCRVLNGIHLH